MSNLNPKPTTRFTTPPIPLATGDVFTTEGGYERDIRGVAIVVATKDGETQTVPLTREYGGWWAKRP